MASGDASIRGEQKFGSGDAPVSVILDFTIRGMKQKILAHISSIDIPQLDAAIDMAIKDCLRPERLAAMVKEQVEQEAAQYVKWGIRTAFNTDEKFKASVAEKIGKAVKDALTEHWL